MPSASKAYLEPGPELAGSRKLLGRLYLHADPDGHRIGPEVLHTVYLGFFEHGRIGQSLLPEGYRRPS